MNPTTDPTDRSMLRETMTRTIPVARIAIRRAWTENVRKLTGEMMSGCRDAEPDPDDDEGDDHAEQAQVDLGRPDQVADAPADRDRPVCSGAVPATSVMAIHSSLATPDGLNGKRPAPRGPRSRS